MGNIIIIVVLVILVAIALKSSRKHFRGEGGCCGGGCGGGCGVKTEKKHLSGEKIGEKILHIEGMHCENCKSSVEFQLNRIDGAAAEVNLKKNHAVVSMSRVISDQELIQAVERADFTVTGIESKEV